MESNFEITAWIVCLMEFNIHVLVAYRKIRETLDRSTEYCKPDCFHELFQFCDGKKKILQKLRVK